VVRVNTNTRYGSPDAGPEPDAGPDREPVGPEPVGPEPVGPEPVGPEPVGPEPVGPEPAGPDPGPVALVGEVAEEPRPVSQAARPAQRSTAATGARTLTAPPPTAR
jgi:hypothetical protein